MGPAGSTFEGKTLDEAVRKGLDALGLTRAEAAITVVEEGSGGFLGFGARPFKVRVMPRPGGAIREAAVREDDDRRSRDRGGRGRDRGGRGGDRGRDRGGRGGDRGRDRGRGGEGRREERGQPAMAGSERDRGPRHDRGERGPRPERGDREVRGDRGEREPRGDREPRGERDATGGRPDRGPRGGRDERRGEERRVGDQGGFGEDRRRPEERRRGEDRGTPAEAGREPIEARGEDDVMGRPGAESGEGRGEGGGGRRRRRRGRRGGAGGGMGAGAGAVMTMPPDESGPPADAVAAPARIGTDEASSEPWGEPAPMASASGGESGGGRGTPSEESGATLTGEALAAEGKRCTAQLLSAMGFEATLRATVDGDRVTVVATVEDGENLIAGERDEVRQAMQQILNRLINRGERSHYHLQLEINDFWEKRESDLKALAARLAEEALAKNGEVMTDYLNAQERRIIHVTLREDTRVKTWSLGIGHIKRLAVAPAGYEGGPADES